MATNAQTLANQTNARKSTGPLTPEGKAATSQNALRHGLATSQILIPGEDPAAYDALLDAFTAQFLPATLTETLLVLDLTKHRWLADRAVRLQAEQFAANPGTIPASLGVLIRYQTTNERAYQKALALLTAELERRFQLENGFVSQKDIEAAAASNQKAHEAILDHLEFGPMPSADSKPFAQVLLKPTKVRSIA